MLIGNLGRNPEMRSTQAGIAVCNLALATSERYRDKTTGEQREVTEWHNVVFFDKQAEIIGQYAGKGDKLYIEGQLTLRKWQDKDGNDRYSTEIKGRNFEFLTPKDSGSQGHASAAPSTQKASPPAAQDPEEWLDDDIPF